LSGTSVVAMDAAVEPIVVYEQLRLFQAVASLYRAGMMVVSEEAEVDPILALSQFLFGYAFERKGRSPAYAPIARHAIESIGARDGFWQDKRTPRRVWESFCTTLGEREDAKPNPMSNPLCPRSHSYTAGGRQKKTSQPSAVQFAQERLKEYNYNIVAWARCMLLDGQVPAAHRDLCSINGIGPKIASFFLRDVGWRFEIQVDCRRELLQPVDVWVERTVRRLDPAARGQAAEWIVQASDRAGVLPEAVNAGLWYFGALIAGSEFRLSQALDDPRYARRLVDEHVERMKRGVDAWSHGKESFYADP